jgi:SAM-dependent methyltransferase
MHTISSKRSFYHRLVAMLLAGSNLGCDADSAAQRRVLLGDLRGKVLEIGPGGGPNLAYYHADVTWLGVEPNPYMHPYLLRHAAKLARPVEVRLGVAEALPVDDGSQDAVVSTLVLCSVHDPARALAEIVRVLKPGGRFVYVEHVAAPEGSRLRRVQEWVNPLWKRVADGCHANRESWVTIEAAGFGRVEIEHYTTTLPLVAPHIAGVATK